jgi:hypothetical protein
MGKLMARMRQAVTIDGDHEETWFDNVSNPTVMKG